MSTQGPLNDPGGRQDSRLRAARYRDGVEAETLAALAGRDLSHGVAGTGEPADDVARSDHGPEGIVPSHRGSEAMRLSSTLDAVSRTAVERAIADGHFDHLAYAGRPLPDIVASTDPHWWTTSLMQREEVHGTEGLGPEALLLRVLDAEMDARLDALTREAEVRDELDSFNRRIVEARRQLLGGPPVVTPLRDVDAEVLAWRSRAEERRVRDAEGSEESAAARPPASGQGRTPGHAARGGPLRRWFRRR